MTRTFHTDPIMAAALLADAEKLEALGHAPGPSLEDLYEGVDCYACGEPAVATDINGLDLCQDCADGCRIPDVDA